jgi:hypothetical protein
LTSHVFTNGELSRLFDIGTTEEKAILATFCSLGWEVSSLLELKRAFIESKINQAKDEGKDFIYFQSQRPKTGALRLGVLNPLAIEWLSKHLQQSSGDRLFRYTTKEGVNAMIQRLAREAQITKTGRIHTHLIRKWVMSGLSRAGFNEFQIKYVLGKAIPLSDLTYLQTLQQEIETKYPKAYEYVNIKPARVVTVVDENLTQQLRAKESEINELKRGLQFVYGMYERLERGFNRLDQMQDRTLSDFENFSNGLFERLASKGTIPKEELDKTFSESWQELLQKMKEKPTKEKQEEEQKQKP